MTNITKHDILLPKRTVLGRIELVQSVTPMEVQFKEWPKTQTSQDRVTRIRREPTRLTYYAPGQSLHCQQNIVDASMHRPPNRPYMIPPPPMFWQYHPMPPLVYPNYSATPLQPTSQVLNLLYQPPVSHLLQVNLPYHIAPRFPFPTAPVVPCY